MKILKMAMNKLLKLPLIGVIGKTFNYISTAEYMSYFTWYLKRLGIRISGVPKFIAADAYFDGNNYEKISLGDNITISREVMLLTHDYSITTAFAAIGNRIERGEGEVYFSGEIKIGDNCFVGARVSILPNTVIGNNVMIGACSVVKGMIPDDSIVVGNPARVIGSTTEYAKKHFESCDYLTE